MKTKVKILIGSLVLLACYWCTNKVLTSTQNKYYDIQKIEVYSFFTDNDPRSKSFTIEDSLKIRRIVDEINSLSTGKWSEIVGKEGAAIIHIDLIDKNNKSFGLGLYKNAIVQKGEGYRQLGVTSFSRQFDMDKTPELKEIYHYFNSEDQSN